MRVGTNTNAAGSAYVELGATKVLCAVFGPRENVHAFGDLVGPGTLECEVRYAPFAHRSGKRERGPAVTDDERLASSAVYQALLPALLLDRFPKSVIEVQVMVLEADGGEVPAAVTAAALALCHAGFHMRDMPAAAMVAVVGSSSGAADKPQLLVDPTAAELASCRAHTLLCLLPRRGVVTHARHTGVLPAATLAECITLATDGCMTVLEEMRAALAAVAPPPSSAAAATAAAASSLVAMTRIVAAAAWATALLGVAFAQTAWQRIAPIAPITPRSSAIGFSTASRATFLGGQRTTSASLPSLNYYYGNTSVWENADTAGTAPDRAATTLDADGRLWVFGGVDASTGRETNRMAVLDPATGVWTSAPTSGSTPPVRRLAVMAFLSNCSSTAPWRCFLLYGGETQISASSVNRLSDLWAYWPDLRTWTQTTTAIGDVPPALSAAAATASLDGRAMYVFGGAASTGASGDMYVIDPQGFYWSDPKPSEMTNLALRKDAFMSSTYKISATILNQWCNASLAVDGASPVALQGTGSVCQIAATTATTTGNALTTTGGEFDPWFYVDLGSTQSFDTLAVYTRASSDMGPGRWAAFQVYFGNDATPPNRTLGRLPGAGNNQRCPNMPSDLTVMANFLTCTGVGRYVWLYIPPGNNANRYMFISEFQVLQRRPWVWRKLSGYANVAMNKGTTAFAQSIYFDNNAAGDPMLSLDGILANNWPYLTHTNSLPADCSNIFITVDLGDIYDVNQYAVWPRTDCCTYRSQRIEFYVGNSRDWKYNTRVSGATQINLQASNPGTYYASCPATFGATAPGTACWTQTLPTTARGRYVSIRKIPWSATACGSSALSGQDDNVINIAEFQIYAQRLLNQPSARSSMAYTTYRGALVVAGGADSAGFRLNDVRLFNLATNSWVPAVVPLGTPPAVRTFASLLPIPNATLGAGNTNVPSPGMLLAGGIDSTGTAVGDLNLLRFAQCSPSPYDAAGVGVFAGISTETCNSAGTVCSYVCTSGFAAANGNGNTIICGANGQWIGTLPVCVPISSPSAPISLSAVLSPVSNTSVNVSWSPPAFGGLWPITQYRVSAVPVDFIETFEKGFRNPADWSVALTDQPTASLYQFDPATGALVIDNDAGAGSLPYNGMVLTRTWPSTLTSVSPDGDFAVETYMWLDSVTARQAQNSQVIGLCFYDLGVWRLWTSGTGRQDGACQFFAGLRKNGGVFQYGFESFYASTGGTYSATGFNFWWNSPQPAVYVRVERYAAAGEWRMFFKFQASGPWQPAPKVPATDTRLINGTFTRPLSQNLRVGFMSRTWSGTVRLLGYFKYLRFAPVGACVDPGSTRVVAANVNSVIVSGLTAGLDYNFQVQSLSPAGLVSPAATIGPVTTLINPAGITDWVTNIVAMYGAGTVVDAISKTAWTKTCYQVSVWNADVLNFGCRNAIDGVPDNGANLFAQAGRLGGYYNPAGSLADKTLASAYTGTAYVGGTAGNVDPLGDWWAVDLGIRTSVKALYISGRQNSCCVGRTSNMEVWIGNAAPPYFNQTTRCDPTNMPVAAINNAVATVTDPFMNRALPYSGMFQCTLSGRYVYLRAPQSLGIGNMQDGHFNFGEVRIYASNSCPARTATGATSNTPLQCNTGKYGDVCVHQCMAGYVQVSGSGVANCDGDAWDADPLVCTPVCPIVPAPAYVATCTQTYFTDNFNDGLAASRWVSLQPTTQGFNAKWFSVDGVLEASTRLGCFDQMVAIANNNKIAAHTGDFTVGVSVRLPGATQAGVVFRASTPLDYYRFVLDGALGIHVLERVKNGIAFPITDIRTPVLTLDTWYSISVFMSAASGQINITVNGNLVISTFDLLLPVGGAGVFAATTALFDDFFFSVPCNGCTGAINGETCSFTCAPGMIASGPTTRTCSGVSPAATGTWSPLPSSSPLVCTVPAPTFFPSVLSVSEDAPKNAPVGMPLIGSSSSADFQLQWTIVTETPSNPNLGSIFYVDLCSGQVKLRQQGVMDAYTWTDKYVLLVRASVAGFVGSADTFQNITVNVLKVDTPPNILPTTLSLPENSATAVIAGLPLWWDRENSTVTWTLVNENTGGALAVRASDGAISVTNASNAGCVTPPNSNVCSSTLLDFETYGGAPFAVTVTARQPSTCCGTVGVMQATATVYVQLTDANDAPRVTDNQLLRILNTAATANAVVGTVAATDQDGATSAFFSATSFSLIAPGTQSTYAVCVPSGAGTFPTNDGTATGTALFTVTSATGEVKLAGSGIPVWTSRPAFAAYGSLARSVFTLCVKVTDGLGAWSIASVPVMIEADIQNTPVIRSWDPPAGGMDTRGGQSVIFSGSGFASGISAVTATYSNTAGYSYAATGCAVVNATALRCNTVPGVGADLTWLLYADGVLIPSSAGLLNSYRAPSVSSVGALNTLFTNGTASTGFVVFNAVLGTFPPVGSNETVTIKYGTSNEYSCNHVVNTADAHQLIRCYAAPGIGANLPWSLTIAGQTTTSAQYSSAWPLFSYLLPTITRIAAACSPMPCTPSFNLTGLNTAGNERFTVTGSNFGPSGSGVVVGFGGSLGDKVQLSCVQGGGNSAHTTLTCITPPGVGTGHALQITVGAQQLTAPYRAVLDSGSTMGGFHYLPPRVTRVYGPGAIGANTAGGQVLYIDGVHFGPVAGLLGFSASDYVAYGRAPSDVTRYLAAGCRVVASPDAGSGGSWSMQCVTTEGTGSGHSLFVSIGGQASPIFAAGISYGVPQISGYSGAGSKDADTLGGEPVIITGTNFGPGPAHPQYSTYFAARMAVSYGVRLENGPFTNLTYFPSGCTITVPHTELTCQTLPGAGRSLVWEVVLDGQVSSVPTTAYAAPVVSAITDAVGAAVTTANVNGGTVLHVTGRFFGPPDFQGRSVSLVQRVTFGPTGVEVTVPPTQWTAVSQAKIVVTLPPGTGQRLKIQVAVADQLSLPSDSTFSYAPPRIAALTPNHALTFSNPRSPTLVTITAFNLPLLDTRSRIGVLFGNDPYAIARSPVLPAATVAGVAAATNADGSVNITFPLPDQGSGVRLAVRITITPVGSTSPSFVTPVLNDVLDGFNNVVGSYPAVFSYDDPIVTDVIVSRARFILPAVMTGGVPQTPDPGAVPCPFPYDPVTGAQSGAWRCDDLSLKMIEITGSAFGLYPTALPDTTVPIADRQDGVTKDLTVLLNNDTFVGEVWSNAVVFLASWTHNRVVVYSPRYEGILRLRVTSTDYTGATVVQAVVKAFANRNPEIGSLTGAVSNVPTTGGDPSGASGALGVVELSVSNLVSVQRLIINVGPFNVPANRVIDPRSNSPFADDATLASWINTVGSAGPVTIRFIAPPGQGKNVAVQVINMQSSGGSSGSNTGYTISYAAPVIQKISLVNPDGSDYAAPVDVSTRPTIRAPTDGTIKVRIFGSNLGLSPLINIADQQRVWQGVTPCPASALSAISWPASGFPQGDTCYQALIPAGEGTGALFPESFPTSQYVLDVEAGATSSNGEYDITAQNSAAVVYFAYEAPQVTGVLPVDASQGLPTRGNVAITVTGRNFGVGRDGRPPSIVDVQFGLPGVGTFFPCLNVQRLSHYTINCTLPEGSGRDLSVRVTVADQVSTVPAVFSYDGPRITSVTSSEGSTTVAGITLPVSRGATNGTAILTITGANFGVADPAVHCMALAWANRRNDVTRVTRCDNAENFLGEGEVPAANVLSWDHETIVVQVPEGLGRKEIELSIRGAGLGLARGSADIPRFWYSAPVIYDMHPALVDTEGGEVVILRGENFGPAPRNTSNPDLAFSSDVFTPGLPLSVAPSLPTAQAGIIFHRSCVALARDYYGAPVPDVIPILGVGYVPLGGCDTHIISWTHTEIQFASQPGIGVNRSVTMIVNEAQSYFLSNVATFSYKAPEIMQYSPSVVYLGPDDSTPINILGLYFGNEEKADEQGWTAAERAVRVNIGSQACVNPGRRRESGETIVFCEVPVSVPAGYQVVNVTVAGQTGSRGVEQRSRALLTVCAAGYYAHMNETCLRCPAQNANPFLSGAVCDGYRPMMTNLESRFTYPRPLAGWYNLNSSDAWTVQASWGSGMMSACPEGFQDNGRDVCIVPCDPSDACLGDNHCKEGYASKAPMFRCASCDSGYYKRAGQCIRCPDSPGALFVGFALLVIVVAAVGFMLNKKQVNIAVISIGIDFFQVLAIFSQSKIQWPAAVKELMHVLSAFNLNIEIVAPECLIPDVSYKQKFWFIMILPLCVGFMLLATFLVLAFNKAVIKGREKKRWFSHKPTLVSSTLVLVYMLYLYLTRTIFDVFNCTPTSPPDGYTYLSVVFERCGVAGGTQVTLLPYAVAGLVIYTAGYPSFIAYTLYKNRELVMEDQLLRAKGVGNDKLTNPHAYAFRKQFGRSYFQFKPDNYSWVLAIILRKFFIALTAVVFNKNSSFQMAACLLVMFLAYAAQVQTRPYMSPSDYEQVLADHERAAFVSIVHSRLKSAIAGIETRGRKRGHRNVMNSEGKIDRTAVLGVLSSWLFNYNTVEAVMIFAAVIVCLMGIMYESNQVSGMTAYPGSQDSVTGVVLGVIIVAIVYFFTVLVTEIVVLANEQSRTKQLAKAAARKKASGDKEPSSERKALKAANAEGGNADFNVGKVESQMNPLFLNKSGEGANALAGDAGLSAILAQRTPPPPEMWTVFQTTFADLHRQLTDAQSQLVDAKRAAQLGPSSASAAAAAAMDAGSGPAGVRAKTQFAPQQLGANNAGVNPLLAKRGFSLKAASGKRSSAAASDN